MTEPVATEPIFSAIYEGRDGLSLQLMIGDPLYGGALFSVVDATEELPTASVILEEDEKRELTKALIASQPLDPELVNVFICTYEEQYADMVGHIDVCTVHDNNSRWSSEYGDHRPCLTVDPWS